MREKLLYSRKYQKNQKLSLFLFVLKTNPTDKLLARLMNKKREKTPIAKIRMKKRTSL